MALAMIEGAERDDLLSPGETVVEYTGAIEMTVRLASEEGIFAGISSGANVVGAHRLAERLGPDAVIVTLAVDTGFNYLSPSPLRRRARVTLRLTGRRVEPFRQ